MPLDTQTSVWNDDAPQGKAGPPALVSLLPAKNLENFLFPPLPKSRPIPLDTHPASSSRPFLKSVFSVWKHGCAWTAILGPDSLYCKPEKPIMRITTIPRNPYAAEVTTQPKAPQVLAELHP